MSKKSFALILTLVILIVFGTLALWQSRQIQPTDSNYAYILENSAECERISFTCPYQQIPFSDETGCGCQPLPADQEDNPDSRRLVNLVKEYLSEKVIQPTQPDGHVFADFRFLDGTEEGTELSYQVYTYIQEFYPTDNQVHFGQTLITPIVLDIEQTGKNYIIWAHTLPATDENYDRDIAFLFTADAQDWILNGDHSFAERTMLTTLRSQASLSYQLPIYEKETTDENTEETTTAETTDTASTDTASNE